MKSLLPISDELEKEVVKMLADGMKANNIARKIRCNEQRLAAILHELRSKYDCNNSTHLVAYFLRNKIIE